MKIDSFFSFLIEISKKTLLKSLKSDKRDTKIIMAKFSENSTLSRKEESNRLSDTNIGKKIKY